MRTLYVLLLLLYLTVPMGCGGGGGGDGGPDSSLSGWWLLAHDLPDSVVTPGPARHRGSDFLFLSMHMVLQGTTLTAADPDYEYGNRSEYHLTVLSPDRMEGTMHVYASGAPSGMVDVVMLRIPPPIGTFTITGNADGGPIDVRSSTSYGLLARAPAAGGGFDYEVQIVDRLPDAHNVIGFGFHLGGFWAPPAVYDITEEATAGMVVPGVFHSATNGTVTFTELNPDRIRGEYELILGLNGAVTGTFDVPVVDSP